MTYYEETPCEHGFVGEHWHGKYCPGGSRIVLEQIEPDYRAHVRQNKALNVSDKDARLIIDAALSGGMLVKENE